MNYIPDKGDIVWINFNPSSGKEIMKRRPAFVISRKIFNNHTGMAILAPITSTIRNIKLEVLLPESMATKGSVLVYQFKSLDFKQRQATFIENSPESLTHQITGIAKAIIL